MDDGGSGEKRTDHDRNNTSPATIKNSSPNQDEEVEPHITIDIPSKSHEDLRSVKSTSFEDTGATNVYLAPIDSRATINRVSFADERNLVRVFSEHDTGISNENAKTQGWKTSRSELSTCVRKSYNWEHKSSNQYNMPEIHGKVCKSTCDLDMGELLQSTLANYLWTYPRVEQRITAYPLAMGGGAGRSAALSSARKKSEHLKKELEKEPAKHRVSVEDPKIAKLTNKFPKPKDPPHVKPMILNTNMNMAAATTARRDSAHLKPDSKTRVRRRSHSSGGHMSPYHGGSARRASQATFGSQISIRSNPEQTQSILHSIRVKDKETHGNGARAKLSRCKEKLCAPCARCVSSRKCTYFTFFTVIAIVTIGCICAIVFPIVKLYIDKN